MPDLCARTLDNPAVALDQCICLQRKRLDFRGKWPGKLFGLPLSYLGERTPDISQRPQRQEDGDNIDAHHSKTEQAEITHEAARKLADFGFQFADIAHHAEAGDPVSLSQHHFGFQNLYLVACRPVVM